MNRSIPTKKQGFLKWLLWSIAHVWRDGQCIFWSLWISLVIAGLGALVKYLEMEEEHHLIHKFMPSEDIYKASTTLVTMMIVFHTAQSYSRFMSGITLVYQMAADFMDTASLLTAFCKASNGTKKDKSAFLNTMARLFSMLFVSCLADLEHQRGPNNVKAHRFDLLDPEGLDQATLKVICQSHDKTMAVNQRIVDMMMAGIETKVLSCPPPILSRAFQELGMGVARFQEALKFKDTPFPVPYIVVADLLMIIHSLMTPFVMARWADTVQGGMFFSFLASFSFWALHGIAEELDNPFSAGQKNLDAKAMTDGFNEHVLSLLAHNRLASPPGLSDIAEELTVAQNAHADAEAPTSSKKSNSFSKLLSAFENLAAESVLGLEKSLGFHESPGAGENETNDLNEIIGIPERSSLNETMGVPERSLQRAGAEFESQKRPLVSEDLETGAPRTPCISNNNSSDGACGSTAPPVEIPGLELRSFASDENLNALLHALRHTSQVLDTLLQQAACSRTEKVLVAPQTSQSLPTSSRVKWDLRYNATTVPYQPELSRIENTEFV